VRRLANAALWLIAPGYVAWRSARPAVSDPPGSFRRWNPRAMRWDALLAVPGAATTGLAVGLGEPGLAIFGIAWALIGGFRLTARLLIPRGWAGTEMRFTAMTAAGMPMRAALAVGFVASLVLARWTLAVAFGIAGAVLTVSGVVAVLVLQRIAASRRAKGA